MDGSFLEWICTYFHKNYYDLNPFCCVLWGAFYEYLDPQWFCMSVMFVQEEDPCLGIALNTKETLPNFLENVLC